MVDCFKELSPVIQALYATLFTWSFTALGAGMVFFFKKTNKFILDSMLGLAAGIMMAATVWSLIIPAIEIGERLGLKAIMIVAVGFLGGCFLIYVVDLIMNKVINKRQNDFSLNRVALLVISITLHNIPEGLAVGVAFGALLHNIEGASLVAALSITLAIAIQNLPEGMIVSVPLKREGFSRFKAFFYGQLSGLVEPMAGILGALLVLKIEKLLPFLLSFAGGAMMFVAVAELIPESQKHRKSNLIGLFTMLGFVIMMVLDITLG